MLLSGSSTRLTSQVHMVVSEDDDDAVCVEEDAVLPTRL